MKITVLLKLVLGQGFFVANFITGHEQTLLFSFLASNVFLASNDLAIQNLFTFLSGFAHAISTIILSAGLVAVK